ncbi:MAG: hypothetical protein JWQ35_205 [Bacteriovoracaceae bacterium]|nr:hypothetical protein [Bacteriovoracaceae bacterium]
MSLNSILLFADNKDLAEFAANYRKGHLAATTEVILEEFQRKFMPRFNEAQELEKKLSRLREALEKRELNQSGFEATWGLEVGFNKARGFELGAGIHKNRLGYRPHLRFGKLDSKNWHELNFGIFNNFTLRWWQDSREPSPSYNLLTDREGFVPGISIEVDNEPFPSVRQISLQLPGLGYKGIAVVEGRGLPFLTVPTTSTLKFILAEDLRGGVIKALKSLNYSDADSGLEILEETVSLLQTKLGFSESSTTLPESNKLVSVKNLFNDEIKAPPSGPINVCVRLVRSLVSGM